MAAITVLAAVVLGGVFGSATATVESISDGAMIAAIEVEVAGSPETVVAHLSFQDDEPLTLPLLNRGDGLFGLRTELDLKNYFVVFEVVGENGQRSEPVSLAQMGADLSPESGGDTTTTVGDDGLNRESRQMLWLAVALGAASLSLLAFWVLGGRVQDEEEGEVEDQDGADDRDKPPARSHDTDEEE